MKRVILCFLISLVFLSACSPSTPKEPVDTRTEEEKKTDNFLKSSYEDYVGLLRDDFHPILKPDIQEIETSLYYFDKNSDGEIHFWLNHNLRGDGTALTTVLKEYFQNSDIELIPDYSNSMTEAFTFDLDNSQFNVSFSVFNNSTIVNFYGSYIPEDASELEEKYFKNIPQYIKPLPNSNELRIQYKEFYSNVGGQNSLEFIQSYTTKSTRNEIISQYEVQFKDYLGYKVEKQKTSLNEDYTGSIEFSVFNQETRSSVYFIISITQRERV